MAERINESYNRSDKHRGEHGNMSGDALVVTPNSGDAAADVIVIDNGPWDTDYFSVIVASDARTAGLEVKVGARQHMSDYEVDDYFGTVTIDAAGGATELIAMSKPFVNADGIKKTHDIIVTLGGTVTPDEPFEVRMQRRFNGAPA